MKIILFLGRQGSGKGTQAKALVNEFGFEYIGSGDLLRKFFEGQSFSAKKTKEVLNKGHYAPTPVIFRLWMDKLDGSKERESTLPGIVFDGSPRKLLEAELLDQALEWYEWENAAYPLLIEISRAEAFSRLIKRRICQECGKLIPWLGKEKEQETCEVCGGKLVKRADDTPEAINSRLDLFETETIPVLSYYKERGKLVVVNGQQSIGDVYKDVKRVLKLG